MFSHFSEVWKVRENHLQSLLPSSYMFLLTCCYKQDCPHPRCRQEPPLEDLRWFPNGPTLQQSVLPVPDPARPLGYPNCTAYRGTCSGHFLSPQQAFNTQARPMAQPPSVMLKDFFNSLHGSEPTDAMVKTVAEKTLLPTDEVRLWLEHLRTVNLNRKRGASKAASTRRRNRQPQPNIAGQVCATQSQFQTSHIPVSQLESTPQTGQRQSQTNTYLNRVGQQCPRQSQFQASQLESTPQTGQRQSQTNTYLGQECPRQSQFQASQ